RGPIEARAAIVSEHLAGEFGVDRIGEGPRILEVGVAGLEPQEVGMRGESKAARDAMVEAGAVLQSEEAFAGALAGDELTIPFIHVRFDEVGAFGGRLLYV